MPNLEVLGTASILAGIADRSFDPLSALLDEMLLWDVLMGVSVAHERRRDEVLPRDVGNHVLGNEVLVDVQVGVPARAALERVLLSAVLFPPEFVEKAFGLLGEGLLGAPLSRRASCG